MVNKKPNYTYGFGMFTLSIICFIAGFISMRLEGMNPYGAGILTMGLFLGIQYLKELGRTPQHIIRFLTWIAVCGFLIVDIILFYYWIK